ncbi:MAG: hypothetical protein QXR09_03455 [Candidatus Aenigmatarchaeota archaeon]
MLEYLKRELKSYREVYCLLDQFHKLQKNEISEEEFLQWLMKRYCHVDWELCEKIAEILTSEEIWKDGRNHYRALIPLQNREPVSVEIYKDAKFLVVGDGKKRVRFGVDYLVKVEENELDLSISLRVNPDK